MCMLHAFRMYRSKGGLGEGQGGEEWVGFVEEEGGWVGVAWAGQVLVFCISPVPCG